MRKIKNIVTNLLNIVNTNHELNKYVNDEIATLKKKIEDDKNKPHVKYF